jgi:hypothetical protein
MSPSDQGSHLNPTAFTWGAYAIGFIDLLGQRDKLRRLKGIPHSGNERLMAEAALKDAIEPIIRIRNHFRDGFEGFSKGIVDGGLPSDLRDNVTKAARLNVFSDCVVVSIPLRSNDQHRTPALALFSALAACSSAVLGSFVSGHPVRGGIDVGSGVELSEFETYGPALERAHFLESECALYPRILIGDELSTYVSFLESSSNLDFVRGVGHRIQEMTTIDDDGSKMLDYLGAGIKRISLPNYASQLVKPAYDFVVDQCRAHRISGDEKLRQRYGRLRHYFESRLALWQLAANKD